MKVLCLSVSEAIFRARTYIYIVIYIPWVCYLASTTASLHGHRTETISALGHSTGTITVQFYISHNLNVLLIVCMCLGGVKDPSIVNWLKRFLRLTIGND